MHGDGYDRYPRSQEEIREDEMEEDALILTLVTELSLFACLGGLTSTMESLFIGATFVSGVNELVVVMSAGLAAVLKISEKRTRFLKASVAIEGLSFCETSVEHCPMHWFLKLKDP